MSCNPRLSPIPLALAVAFALGSIPEARGQAAPSFKLLLGDAAPIDLSALPGLTDPGANPVFLRFEPSNGTLNVRAADALLCFDFTAAAPPAPRPRLGLTLPSGTSETLLGVTAGAISPGSGADPSLVYVGPTPQLDCHAFPTSQLAALELLKQSKLSGVTGRIFASSFNLREALPALLLEVRNPIRDPAPTGSEPPTAGSTIQYTVRVSALNRGVNGTIRQVRIRDYVPPVGPVANSLGLTQAATLVRCSINGIDQVDAFNPDQPACDRDAAGFLRFDQYPDAAPGLAMPAGSTVEFELRRTVIAAPLSPGSNQVYVIAAASGHPDDLNLGSPEDASHVFTFS